MAERIDSVSVNKFGININRLSVTAIETIISKYAGSPLNRTPVHESENLFPILPILTKLNGFFAFESALHFYSEGCACGEVELLDWNLDETWKHRYGHHHVQNTFCFAANVFGDQFCFLNSKYGRFDVETGEIESIADNLEDWAAAILDEPDYHLGFQLAHLWQERYGSLKPGWRLVPKKPFILGGEFELDNLFAESPLRAVLLRAEIATQLSGLQDGATVQIDIE